MLVNDQLPAVREWVSMLVNDQLLAAPLVPHLASWRDLSPALREGMLGMISSFGLAVRYDGAAGGGGGAVPEDERQWLCTCRMHRCGDAGLTEKDWAEFPVVAKYRLSFLPPGLFPRFQAAQILDPLLKSEVRSALVVGDGRLAMKIRSALGGEEVRLQVAISKREGEAGVWVAATSVPVLRGLCVLLESHDDVCVFHDERRLLQVLRGLSVLLESLLVKSFIGVDCSTESQLEGLLEQLLDKSLRLLLYQGFGSSGFGVTG
ncbi:hypothetical protein T484DRAFT_1817072 [Baffinella frigidus]|nr:hypothetical protein T484DRAFT_1817072 [Cryptophyta sp. CCMP2293]